MQMIGTSLLSPLLAHSLSMASVIMSGGLFKFLSRALWRRRDGSEIHFILHFFFCLLHGIYCVYKSRTLAENPERPSRSNLIGFSPRPIDS